MKSKYDRSPIYINKILKIIIVVLAFALGFMAGVEHAASAFEQNSMVDHCE